MPDRKEDGTSKSRRQIAGASYPERVLDGLPNVAFAERGLLRSASPIGPRGRCGPLALLAFHGGTITRAFPDRFGTPGSTLNAQRVPSTVRLKANERLTLEPDRTPM